MKRVELSNTAKSKKAREGKALQKVFMWHNCEKTRSATAFQFALALHTSHLPSPYPVGHLRHENSFSYIPLTISKDLGRLNRHLQGKAPALLLLHTHNDTHCTMQSSTDKSVKLGRGVTVAFCRTSFCHIPWCPQHPKETQCYHVLMALPETASKGDVRLCQNEASIPVIMGF